MKRWTAEDYERLREGWGNTNGGAPALAAAMGRSLNSIRIKAAKLKLGPWVDGSEWMTLSVLFRVLFRDSYSYAYTRLQELGLPVRQRKAIGSYFFMVRIEEFWRWAEGHQRDLDFADFEENALGREPDWVKAKRRRDREKRQLGGGIHRPWSAEEDELLRLMCRTGTTWAALEEAFTRSVGAIRRRVYDLNCEAPKRRHPTRWTAEELETVVTLNREGYSVDCIARRMGKTASSVRGKLECLKKQQKQEVDL